MWKLADDVVEMPVSKKNLQTRVQGLTKIRKYSKQVEENQRKLEKKNRQLKLYYNAINSTITGLIITDPHQEDMPITFCNKAFCELTGYSEQEVLGRNCRFLQGDDHDQEGRKVIREAIENGEGCETLLRNYRKDGTMFWNELKLSPIKNNEGDIQYYVGVQNDVTRLIEIQNEIKNTKNQWENIVSQSPHMIQVSVGGIVKFMNRAGAFFHGYDDPEDLVGLTVLDLHPEEEHSSLRDRLKELENGQATEPKIYRIKDRNSETRYLRVQSIPVIYKGEPAAQTVGEDVTRLKELEIELKDLLEQKHVLLQEVHHRVKNNFAIISGLIEMQISSIDNDEAASYLRDTQMRIISIAKVHELLYSQENLNEIQFDHYINELLKKLKSTVANRERGVEISLDTDSVVLSLDQAIPAGLLLNELITNSFKHAFAPDEKIKIDISITIKDGVVAISFRDYGKGLEDGQDFFRDGNFGATVIKVLLAQLKAEWDLESEKGIHFQLSFKKAVYRGPSHQVKRPDLSVEEENEQT